MIPADVVESACGRDFFVDSRNENLPEKCIQQNCASRPGRHAARDFLFRAPRAAEDTKRCAEAGPPGARRLDATDGCRKPRPGSRRLFRVVLYNEYRNFNVSPPNWTRTAARSRPRAPTATAPAGLGGRRPAGRPSSVPAWASPAAPAWDGARRR